MKRSFLKKGTGPFYKEYGILYYPKEAWDIKEIKIAFLDDKAWLDRGSPSKKRGLSLFSFSSVI
jgi:hypothetical protein